ncbi:hypothetical protein B0H14DRAFT_3450169 [Mycena olivaceomarginata]|nr:hypothetical protein B0H14DRAFT_3450169 [Mycena olivaceomarginata]
MTLAPQSKVTHKIASFVRWEYRQEALLPLPPPSPVPAAYGVACMCTSAPRRSPHLPSFLSTFLPTPHRFKRMLCLDAESCLCRCVRRCLHVHLGVSPPTVLFLSTFLPTPHRFFAWTPAPSPFSVHLYGAVAAPTLAFGDSVSTLPRVHGPFSSNGPIPRSLDLNALLFSVPCSFFSLRHHYDRRLDPDGIPYTSSVALPLLCLAVPYFCRLRALGPDSIINM